MEEQKAEQKSVEIGRLIGLDYGEHKTGVALSDLEQRIVIELESIDSKKVGRMGRMKRVREIIEENNCQGVVIGLPLGLSGQETLKSREVREFGKRVCEKTDFIQVIFWDERLSSEEAEWILRNEGSTKDEIIRRKDMLSAKLILQGYIESRK